MSSAGRRSGSRCRREARLRRLAAAAACLALACGSPEDDLRRHLERARAARSHGQHAAAVIEYRNVLQVDPGHAAAHYELALSLLAVGRGADAAWELRESFRLEPQNLDARLRLAWLALAAGNPQETLEQAAAILQRDPEHLEGRLARVAGLLAVGDADRAGAESEAILERWPEEKRAHYNLARARAAQGRHEAAERSLLRFHELDGGSAAATRELLRFYRATDQDARAERFLRRAVPEAAPPDRPELALALADLLERRDRPGEAEEFLRLALVAAPERLDLRERLARLQAEAGRVDEALRLVEEAPAPASPNARISQLEGDLLMTGGRFEAALVRYRAGLLLEPGSRPLRLREAEALLRSGRLDEAAERIGALLEEHPEDPLVALAQVRSLALGARTGEAIESLRGLLARDPQLVPGQFLLGVLQLAMGRPRQALGPLEIAAAELGGPSAGRALGLLAEAQLRVGDFEAATRSAERVLARDAEDLRARIVLAEALQASGSAERAEALLREAPGAAPALHGALARLLVRGARLAEAQREVERALALQPDSVQWVVDLVWVLLEQGKSEEALEIARRRAIEAPAVAEYPNLLGRIALHREDGAGAERAFRKAIEVDAEFVPAYVNLARLALRAERYSEAVELLQSALTRRPGHAEALQELGIVEYRRGNFQAAIGAFREALRADPTSDLTRANLAQAQARAGRDLPDALELARAIRQSQPANPVYAETLGQVLYRSGLHAAAAEQFRAAIQLAPHPIAAYHYRLGLALQEGGDRSGALSEFERALGVDADFADAEDARRRVAELRRPSG